MDSHIQGTPDVFTAYVLVSIPGNYVFDQLFNPDCT